jgi:hypothetical protein
MHFDTKSTLKGNHNHTLKQTRKGYACQTIKNITEKCKQFKRFAHRPQTLRVHGKANITYLEVWLRLFFKVFFTRECIKIIYIFYFLKIIFDIRALKLSKNIKKY